MNCSKILRTAAGVMTLIGLLLIVGAVGTDDYYTEIGVTYPFRKTCKVMLIGFLIAVSGLLLSKYEGRREEGGRMRYTRNLRMAAMKRRIVISWVIVAAVFFLIGGVSGYVLKAHITAIYEEKENTLTTEPLTTENGYMEGYEH